MPEPRLQWTGTDEKNRFHDEERGRIYWASERPLRVPADAVEEYLEQDGWEEPPEVEDPQRIPPGDNESVSDSRAHDQEEQFADEDVRAEPASAGEQSDGDADTQAASADDEDRDFDAADFVADDWRAVEEQIQSGDYDDHLGAIEHAERNRDGEPREASVLGAIKDRRNAPLSSASESDPDPESETETETETDSDSESDDTIEE